VREGIHGSASWEELQRQVLLGEDEFVEKFKEVLEDKKQVKEIPRSQRYIGRPSLDNIFRGQKTKAQRNTSIRNAHMRQGYTLKEIADYLGIHYTTVSKVIAKAEANKK
jgi:putative transposase